MEISEVNKNSKLLIDGVPYGVDSVEFVKPGKGQGIYKIRLRNLLYGTSLEKTFRSGDKVETAKVDALEMQYLYAEGDQYVFMDTGTFEQFHIVREQVGDKAQYLKEGTVVTVLMLETRPIDVQIPNFVELKVTKTETGLKSATVTAQNKAAVLETGATIEVPMFVKEGDLLKVDTRTGTYIERLSKG